MIDIGLFAAAKFAVGGNNHGSEHFVGAICRDAADLDFIGIGQFQTQVNRVAFLLWVIIAFNIAIGFSIWEVNRRNIEAGAVARTPVAVFMNIDSLAHVCNAKHRTAVDIDVSLICTVIFSALFQQRADLFGGKELIGHPIASTDQNCTGQQDSAQPAEKAATFAIDLCERADRRQLIPNGAAMPELVPYGRDHGPNIKEAKQPGDQGTYRKNASNRSDHNILLFPAREPNGCMVRSFDKNVPPYRYGVRGKICL